MTKQTATAAGTAPFTINLDFFSGPMDLLLHLVRQQEVSVETVQMSVVAEQYLQIVNNSTAELDIDLASEYLVIAATLLAIKSRSLLPAAPQETSDDDQVFEESRFFEDLRARLKAYELTKSRAAVLMQSPQLGVDTFARIDRKALLPTPEMLAEPEDVQSLGALFGRLLKRIGGSLGSYKVLLEPVSIVSYMMKIVDSFTLPDPVQRPEVAAGKAPLRFSELLRTFFKSGSEAVGSQKGTVGSQKGTEAPPSASQLKGLIIGSFIATLELVKRGVVSVVPAAEGDDFALNYRLAEGAGQEQPIEFASEFDEPPASIPSLSGEAPAEVDRSTADKVVKIAEYRQARELPPEGEEHDDERPRKVGNLERQGH